MWNTLQASSSHPISRGTWSARVFLNVGYFKEIPSIQRKYASINFFKKSRLKLKSKSGSQICSKFESPKTLFGHYIKTYISIYKVSLRYIVKRASQRTDFIPLHTIHTSTNPPIPYKTRSARLSYIYGWTPKGDFKDATKDNEGITNIWKKRCLFLKRAKYEQKCHY